MRKIEDKYVFIYSRKTQEDGHMQGHFRQGRTTASVFRIFRIREGRIHL